MFPREAAKQCASLIGHGDDTIPVDIIHPEKYLAQLIHTLYPDVLGHGIVDGIAVFQLDAPAADLFAQGVAGRGGSGLFTFGRNEIHQVMHMHHIAAGKDTRRHGLHVFIYDSTVGAAIHGNASAAGQLVFRDKPD